MRLTADFERTLRRYVLGDLDEDLRVELEELLVTDPDAFEALGVVEDELVEEYLDGAGSAGERLSFEQHFLTSPERQRRLGLTRALKERASATIPAPQPGTRPQTDRARPGGRASAWLETWGEWLRPARWQPAWVGVAAVLAVSLIGNAWLASRYPAQEQPPVRPAAGPPVAAAAPASIDRVAAENRELQARLGQEQEERTKAEARARTLETRLAQPRTAVATFALAAGLLRASGSLARVTVPPDAVLVRLRLELPEDGYPLYRAALHDPDGGEVWAVSKLRAVGRPGQSSVVVAVPSELLPRGDYLVKLSGLREGAEPEALEAYPFRVATP